MIKIRILKHDTITLVLSTHLTLSKVDSLNGAANDPCEIILFMDIFLIDKALSSYI